MAIDNDKVKFYNGFLIFERYFAPMDLYDESKTYKEFNRSSRQLVEDKENNRHCINFEEYYSNGTLESAIDAYIIYKDFAIPKPPYSQILDYCFNNLKLDANTFNKIFGSDNQIKNRYADYEMHFEVFDEFRKKDIRITEFLTDAKIKQFFDQRKTERLIQSSKAADINNIGLYI